MRNHSFPFFVSLLSLPLVAQDPVTAQPAAGADTGPVVVAPGLRKLSFGGEYRIRYEGMFDYDLNGDAGASNEVFTQRVRFDIDAVVNDRLRAFIQVQDAREWGEEASTVDDAADGLDLHQGFLGVNDTPLLGGGTRVGRMEVSLGDQRLIGALDWKSGARAFDGVHQHWKIDDGTLHAFVLQAREVINAVNDDARVIGAYYTGKFGEGTTGDGYLILLSDDGLTPGATQQRFTVGTRWVTMPTSCLEVGLEAATQFGEVAGADIPAGDTYAFHVHGTYSFDGAWKPRLTLACDGASGDDPATADNERFNNLFPTAHAHWGMMDLAQWENLFNPWARIAVSPCACSTWSLTWNHLAAQEAGDVFRGPAATLSAGNVAWSKEMGEEFDLLYTRNLDVGKGVKAAAQVGYGVFMPGNGAKDANGGNDDLAHFFYLQFDLRF